MSGIKILQPKQLFLGVAYLYCFKGARASNSLVALREAGIRNVRMYLGSWNEWSRDESLPIETGLPFAAAAE